MVLPGGTLRSDLALLRSSLALEESLRAERHDTEGARDRLWVFGKAYGKSHMGTTSDWTDIVKWWEAGTEDTAGDDLGYVSVFRRMSCRDFQENFSCLFICNQIPITTDHGVTPNESWRQMRFKNQVIAGNTAGGHSARPVACSPSSIPTFL